MTDGKLLPLGLGRDQRPVRHVPSPQPIVGQFGAAPPAMDGVVAAEVFRVCQDGSTEFGQLQSALLVSPTSFPILDHLQRKRPLFKTRDGWRGAMRQTVQQFARFPIA